MYMLVVRCLRTLDDRNHQQFFFRVSISIIPQTFGRTYIVYTHSQVRYSAVVVLKEVYSQLGQEFMTLLPETVPFLAELLEGVDHSMHFITHTTM